MSNLDQNPDSLISYDDGINYWNSISEDVNGMLGGFPQISNRDLAGSRAFIAKLGHPSKGNGQLFKRGVDCGAGIGRITKGLLCTVCQTTDIVEPVSKFTRVIESSKGWEPLREKGLIGRIFNQGLQDWTPKDSYDLMWNQWCLGHLTDEQLVTYLKRCKSALSPEGWIVVKENMSTDLNDLDIFDDVDSSVTRTHENFVRIFEKAGLYVHLAEIQQGFPKALFPVRCYALRPEMKDAKKLV